MVGLGSIRRGISSVKAMVAGSVRYKLLTLVLAPLLLGVPSLLLIVWVWGTQNYDRLMINKVSADLGAAQELFDRVQANFSDHLESFAASHQLMAALENGGPSVIRGALEKAAQDQGLDYLLLLDPLGRVRFGVPAIPEADRSRHLAVSSAMGGSVLHGLHVVSAEDLKALSPTLAARAFLDLLPTPRARPLERTTEDRGLVMTAALPIRNQAGAMIAILEGGVLLNGNLGIIDRVNALVYRASSLPAGSEGTATLFLDDVRIATSVRLKGGQRAMGTRVSQAVYDKTMGEGEPWLGAAQVVDRSYISGYAPLTDLIGRRIGMLYVGFLEEPLKETLIHAMAGIILLFVLVSFLGGIALLRWARSIFLPLERISRVIQQVEDMDDTARVGPIASRDELGRLAQAFDRLLDSLNARREELRCSAQELDAKVAERTAELSAANATLKQAQQQLVMKEKLTAIGELTAGVAHEINNPVAVIQGNLDLMREILGPASDPVATEIRLIDEQISRIQVIINKLLQFARPGDFGGHAEEVDVNITLSDCLVLTRHNLKRSGVEIRMDQLASRPVEFNRVELQQVLINLIVNAIQAMPTGGVLTLEARDFDDNDARPADFDADQGVRITVSDTGLGIKEADMPRIFDPFFTTKRQSGTGLGLSISYAIIAHHGGRITVESDPEKGTRFTLWLRRLAVFTEETLPPVFSARH